MLDYTAMLFHKQEVNFTILHIKSPCQKGSCGGKCGVIFSQKLKKDKELLERKGYDTGTIQTKFIEGSFIESIRQVILEQRVDLIMLGNSSKAVFSTGLFFDKKTLEIITKVKCSIIMVPENAKLKLPKTALLPTDFSITSDYSIFNILDSLSFINQVQLHLLPTGFDKTSGTSRKNSKALISKVINSFKFQSVDELTSKSKEKCINSFDLVLIMAKNLSIFKEVFSTSSDSLCCPETPVLFLHDSRKI
jgi:hypothetical protein